MSGVVLFLGSGGVITPLMLGAWLATALPENVPAVVFFRRYRLRAPPPTLRLGEHLNFNIVNGTFAYVAAFTA